MAGFEADFRKRILGVEAHLTLLPVAGSLTVTPELLAMVRGEKAVSAATPLVSAQVMLRSASGLASATLKGIDPAGGDGGLPEGAREVLSGPQGRPVHEAPPIMLGRELARMLGVSRGDTLHLLSTRGMASPVGLLPAMKRLRVGGVFSAGMQDYDAALAYLHLQDAQALLRMGATVSAIEIRLQDLLRAGEVGQRLQARLGPDFVLRDWMQRNHNLFAALKLEKAVMFIILALIICVAAFNIASSLVMMVMEKTRDIAILMVMGATRRSIRRIFVFKGLIIGAAGTLTGTLLGVGLCQALRRHKLIELPSDVYYITTLPVALDPWDLLLIGAAAMTICLLATLYPARQAAALDAVEAVRYG
jgi:lipoprotein-releasing system permease protein